jgi:hypothetical protein
MKTPPAAGASGPRPRLKRSVRMLPLADIHSYWNTAFMEGNKKVETEQSAENGRPIRFLRFIALFLFLPIVLFMNACSLVMTERGDTTSSGILTAEVTLMNAGAMADYSGVVWVFPKYFPRIWPLDLLVGCRALMFESDPSIELRWTQSSLVIEHDAFAYPPAKVERCYGRAIALRERIP